MSKVVIILPLTAFLQKNYGCFRLRSIVFRDATTGRHQSALTCQSKRPEDVPCMLWHVMEEHGFYQLVYEG